MSFSDFYGNAELVRQLRESVAHGRVPQSMILAGPKGAGKYTLALMLARAVNCLTPRESDGLPDYCGHCRNCEQIGVAEKLDELAAAAVEAREELREADKKETRILIQTHPDILIVPPDPPQMLIKIGQVKHVIHAAYYRPPIEAKRAFSIFTSSAFMKEAANSLLKVLEEPPERATIILLTENPQELLPTIRSRALTYRLGALPVAELEGLIAERKPEIGARERALVARLANGAVGRALHFDLDSYLSSRQDALVLIRSALREPDYTALFKTTESYKAGAEGQEKMVNLLRALNSLLEDLLLILAGVGGQIRNIDLNNELAKLADGVTLEWIEGAARAAAQAEQGMRRNLLRSLSIDAMTAAMSMN